MTLTISLDQQRITIEFTVGEALRIHDMAQEFANHMSGPNPIVRTLENLLYRGLTVFHFDPNLKPLDNNNLNHTPKT
jgi:hypothetical protein